MIFLFKIMIFFESEASEKIAENFFDPLEKIFGDTPDHGIFNGQICTTELKIVHRALTIKTHFTVGL